MDLEVIIALYFSKKYNNKNTSLILLKKKPGNKTEEAVANFLRNVLGIKPRNISLYQTALIHRSASTHHKLLGNLNNERLEYLGDAVLSAIVADYLFKKYPLHPEGPLTEMRSKMVCRERLNTISRKIGLNNLISMETGNGAKSVDGDAFEALIGALFLDKGFNQTKKIVLNKIFLTHMNVDAIMMEDHNFKGKLINWGQKNNISVKFENQLIIDENTKKLHKSIVFVNNKQSGEGLDFTIKKAEQIAAAAAWETLSEWNYEG